MGDGIMALFGAPLAHEDHAVRACYAALRMQESVNRYADGVRRTEGVPIQIRVGLNSGEVVVGAIGNDLKMDYTAIGQTVHLASRMEQMATPGSIMMTRRCSSIGRRLRAGEVARSGQREGMNEPVEVYEVTGAGAARSRLQAAAARGLTRFVGRDAETRATSRRHWNKREPGTVRWSPSSESLASASRGCSTSSRIRIAPRAGLIVESGSVSYGKATALPAGHRPAQGIFQDQDRDNQREIREKVTGKLLTLDKSLEPALPALLSLLDVPVEDAAWQASIRPQRRQRTLDAVKRFFFARARCSR